MCDVGVMLDSHVIIIIIIILILTSVRIKICYKYSNYEAHNPYNTSFKENSMIFL